MLHTAIISSQETFAVRQPVLRPGKPVESCMFPGDDLNTTAHFGVFEDDALIGVISVFKSNNDVFNEEKQYQIRGMAILHGHQKKGLGVKLIEKAEEYIAQQNGKTIWMNAREVAIDFYKKTGYQIYGNPFNIDGIGTHYIMYKHL
ncbi:N-acetyltransferase [Flavobacterium suaedae]|uniref:N-acetyltransferase n=1 Tax=Flavobacterium suaedae TaxID=1767027 RepID=A0ABQ1K2M2_9FLAO|nr:GNAT family N-acetyltransferase [Flavobacterium suaedae]GGB82229.1 N-acetyltransferase [Flavobacterium suaedae]